MEFDYKFLFPTIAAFGALIFSLLNYRRSRLFENENHLHRLKLDIYSKILKELNVLLGGLDEQIIFANDYIKNKSAFTYDEVNEQADIVDDLCLAFEDFIITNSLIIPEKVFKHLDGFCDKMMKTEAIDQNTSDVENTVKKLEQYYDELNEDANKINMLLREDLKIEELNTSLYRRLKK